MIEKIAKLSELSKMLLIASLVSIVLIGLSFIGFAYSQPGWLIGVVAGTGVELVNIILIYKGSEQILKHQKPVLFLLFYALRIVLFMGLVLTLILLQYKAHLDLFVNSFWGALIAYTPMQIVVIVVTLLHKSSGDYK